MFIERFSLTVEKVSHDRKNKIIVQSRNGTLCIIEQRDTGHTGLVPGSGRSPGGGSRGGSSILARTIPQTEEPSQVHREADVTEHRRRENNLILLNELPQPLFSTPGHPPLWFFFLFSFFGHISFIT